MLDRLEAIREQALEEIDGVTEREALREVRVRYLGKKGELTGILRQMGEVDPDRRPAVGRRANAIKEELQERIEKRGGELERLEMERRLREEEVDVTLPGRRPGLGHRHPISQVTDLVKEVFLGLGFSVAEGPEVETEYYNFEALNVPPDHPARDMQDTFYVSDNLLLRTQTSPVQIRVMEETEPPIGIIAPGRVYRCDADVTHSPMFHQVEGLLVAEGIRFSDLKGTLIRFAQAVFGSGRGVRFRPSYFPFTEPSAEMDIACNCGGEGCRVCGGNGWIEILGAGLVHPNVLTTVGLDPQRVSGFAFGMGIERITMLRYGIDDIRLFFENDQRFLRQF